MSTAALLLATATLGVDFGWQPLANGQLEYIIQIEPELLDTLKAGEPIRSEIPPEVRGVRRFRVQIGRDPLPKRETVRVSAEEDRAAANVARHDPPALVPPGIQTRFDSQHWNDQPPPHPNATSSAESATLSKPTFPRDDGKLPREQPSTSATIRPNTGAEAIPTHAPPVTQPETLSSPADSHTKPWGWLTATIVALFASVGINLYQGWTMLGVRRRYHELVDQAHAGRPT